MSDPRASIQRAVAAPPLRSTTLPALVSGTAAAVAAPQIGKPHGNMRCVNLSLSEPSAARLRQLAAELESTLGEVLMDLVQSAVVTHADRRAGRAPQLRRNIHLVSVYALFTPSESADLRSRAIEAGRTVSDYADQVLREASQGAR